MPELHVGCSGYSYQHWRGLFYPEDVPQKQWFAHYRKFFSTVELNVTFYRLPKPETFQRWYQESAPEFCFAAKGSRFITHRKRLVDAEEALERFFGSALELKEKLKVVLWQLAPTFTLSLDRFEQFLNLLDQYPIRHSFEFRHQSWLCDEVVALCRKHNVGLCMADAPQFLDSPPITADFVYIRRHGYGGDYNGSYSSEQLRRDAERIRGYLERGLDVFIYFNNDIGGAAPKNARELITILPGS